ncbi:MULTISPECIES: alkaline phosphatase family protein [Vibrio]|uniref:alkaline phosphatase family protein n=1 Tax=Vibrio TaxID=662 RepID=UPI001EFC3D07|nr:MULTISPECIES: alkaline phosphatase family protein [Vibrio]MCF4172849.1 alkaline phosphatase family protein [Vibrio sp. McD22-P3]MCG9658214.1 alkaline phosphatase family protein [Vibrio mediterranei]
MHKNKLIKPIVTASLLVTLCFNASAALATESKPNLVLQITVDGLRADLIERYKHNFSDNGFKYLMDQGVYYKNANYEHANTETIVGHVSLATGAPPAVHGMVGNVWFDRGLDRLVYNVEDPNYSMLTSGAGVDKSTEIDPTQKAAAGDGRSPEPILSTTFSDELVISNNGQSRVFSVSVKDRGAISLAGHGGKAFWFSKAQSQFVTSDYYYDTNPFWVDRWNEKAIPAKYSGKRWELSLPKDQYSLQENSKDHKVDLGGFARTFPHPYGPASYKYYSTMLTVSPAGDEITADFAKTLLAQEKLGSGDATDYLAISFSSNDYVVHLYGASSLETEDNLIRLDKTLADLFKYVDDSIGLENTLIVLSADHGVPEASPTVNTLGFRQPFYFNKDALLTDALMTRLKNEFGLEKDVIKLYAQPYIYLDHELIAAKNVSLRDVQKVIAEEVMKVKGVATAVTSEDIASNRVPDSRVNELIRNNYHPLRSGDVYMVFGPRTYINDMDGLTIASTHGSPWRYDTHVPVIFAGHNLKPQTVTRPVTPYDIAPTLSGYLDVSAPSGATGVMLEEVFQD